MTDQPENTPELETAETNQKTSESLFDASKFRIPEVDPGAGARVIPLDDEGEDVPPFDELEEEPEKQPIEFDDFYSMFQLAFAAPGEYDEDFKPLAIQPDEEENARKAARVTYDLLKQYVPSWLTNIDSKLMLWLGAGMFFMGKAKILAVILHHKREMRQMELDAAAGAAPVAGAGEGAPSPASDGVSWFNPGEEDEAAA